MQLRRSGLIDRQHRRRHDDMSREEARWLTAGKGAAGRGSAQARVAQGRGREEEAQGRHMQE